ncbi:efflux RND transporter permease subunit [bacterium]|nr:efflux RND transporter permease subunit [bacterium]
MNDLRPDAPVTATNGPIGRLIGFCLDNKLIVFLLVVLAVGWGLSVSPFAWNLGPLPRDPVPVDAIPDLGENQQIVFTEWPGRSPQDVEDQITYPLTVSLLGLPQVRTVRSYSFFGFSTIYVIFNEDADFYDSRSRILEKLGSLPVGTLPDEVRPALGPDATALGQVYWYTLEGRDEAGRPTGGWDPAELRTVQDFHVRDALLAAGGVAEVASVGGFQAEYQVDVDPDALRLYGLSLEKVVAAVRGSNRDVGARSLEINRVEYVVRGVGTIAGVADLERSVVTVQDNVPVLLGDIATVGVGPALRRGALDKEGAEAVGGVVVVRSGENPLAVITRVKAKIAEIAPSLPVRTLPDGRTSRVTVVPFYDRTGLIHETLGTLNEALRLEILITIIVVIVMVRNLRGGLVVAGLLPLAVLMVFIAMKLMKVDANIVALSGIAIAIGTMVDMGVILVENILSRRAREDGDRPLRDLVHEASTEVGSAVLTAVATTIIGFLPVFTLVAAEGKLFRPLAFTKTFALFASVLIAIVVIPPVVHLLLGLGRGRFGRRRVAATVPTSAPWWRERGLLNYVLAIVAAVFLADSWLPLGPERSLLLNILFVLVVVGGVLGLFGGFGRVYPRLLGWCLDHKALFLALPLLLVAWGAMAWLGFDRVFAFLPGAGAGGADGSTWSRVWSGPRHAFPGLGKEFMPPLDEGSFLYMPTTMPHASIGEANDVLAKLDMAIASIPEVEQVVGKLGRAQTALDPAPISMIETVINYKAEFRLNDRGERQRYRFRDGEFVRDEHGELIPDGRGRFFRQWRDGITSEDDIWQEIVRVAKIPGTTSAPRLQPISTRLVMLQSGMRAPMGVKVRGPSLEAIETAALELEKHLKEVPGVNAATVIADRVVGKPYLELHVLRDEIARHGLTVDRVQQVVQAAVGGVKATTSVEGRERFPVLVRYQRERRDDLDEIRGILVTGADGVQVPLGSLVDIRYVRGPMTIKSEDTFLVGYVIFDKDAAEAEVDVVERAAAHLRDLRAAGTLALPTGVSYVFAGSFENQVRSERTLSVVLPVALLLIFLVLYLQFRSVLTTTMVFAGVFVAWAGGFVMVWLYGQHWFLDLHLFGVDLRDLFAIHPINLSVAIWVGFLALFGIATDDGVLMATYLDISFRERRPDDRRGVRRATVAAAERRVRPALMTSATTILALLPVLTLTGRGSDIMIPMAIPSFGGMVVALITLFTVPTLYCLREERRLARTGM